MAASIEDSSIKGHFPFFVSLGERASRLNPSSLRPSGDLTAEPAKGSQHHQTVGLRPLPGSEISVGRAGCTGGEVDIP